MLLLKSVQFKPVLSANLGALKRRLRTVIMYQFKYIPSTLALIAFLFAGVFKL